MITADRRHIQCAKEALLVALIDSRVGGGLKWRCPDVSDETLEKATITALNIIAKDAVNRDECVIASDVIHIDNFGDKHV